MLTHNLLELLKATALDPQYRQARPKRLRFAIFTQVGRVVQHARQQFVRLISDALDGIIRPGRRRLSGPIGLDLTGQVGWRIRHECA